MVFSTPRRIKAKGFIQVIIGNRDPVRWDVLCDQKAAAVPLVDSPLQNNLPLKPTTIYSTNDHH